MLTAAVLAFAAVVELADLLGIHHTLNGGIILLTLWYLGIRECPGEWRERIVAGWLICSVFVAILACVQIFFMPRSRGVWDSPNFLGSYAACNIFIALWLRERGYPWWGTMLPLSANVLALALSQSRGAILAAAVGAVVMYGRRYWWAIFNSAGLAIALLGMNRPDVFADERWHIWHTGWLLASHLPLLGWGLGVVMPGLQGWYNVALDWFVASGIVGLFIGFYLLSMSTLRARNSGPALSFLACWLAQGMLMVPRPETAIALYMMLGVLERNAGTVFPASHRPTFA